MDYFALAETIHIFDMLIPLTKLHCLPLTEIAHASLCCTSVREDMGPDAKDFSRRHPLATWISSIVGLYAGGMLSNFLLGDPILGGLNNNENLFLYSVIWYFIFYCPFDAAYKTWKLLPVSLAFSVLKEISRAKKVYIGVEQALTVFPTGYMIALIIGTIRGNGSGFLRTFQRSIRGVWIPEANELLRLSLTTKGSILASVLFILERTTNKIYFSHNLLYFGIVVFFVYLKAYAILNGSHDRFLPFENKFCAMLMGYPKMEPSQNSSKENYSGRAEENKKVK